MTYDAMLKYSLYLKSFVCGLINVEYSESQFEHYILTMKLSFLLYFFRLIHCFILLPKYINLARFQIIKCLKKLFLNRRNSWSTKKIFSIFF